MKKELSYYIIRLILAIALMISLGIAGEMDYQDHAKNHPPVISY